MLEDIAYLNSNGMDVAVTTTSQIIKLPSSTTNILIKNVGTAEAFVKGYQNGDASNTVAATSTTANGGGMSFLPGVPETYRVFSTVNPSQIAYIAVIGAGATTLRVYCTSGN